MNDDFIKKLLISNQSRVYSLIVNNYFNMIISLKPTLFRIWYCDKLGIEIDLINISSLKSALSREKRNLKSKPTLSNKTPKKIIELELNNTEQVDFKFSNPDEVLPVIKKRITGF